MKETNFKREFYWIGIIILVLWLVRIVDAFIPYALTQWGLHPRSLSGLPGIVLMPFLHRDFAHLFSNTWSLVILLGLLVSVRRSPWLLVIATALTGGALLWLMGRNANHVGASGIVFGLIGFLIVNGFLHRSLPSVAIAIIVGILFGGTLLSGILPGAGAQVSWDGHLCGLLGGAGVAAQSWRIEK